MSAGRQTSLLPFAAIFDVQMASNSLIADADGEELAVKYYPGTTSPITDVDLLLTETGDCAGINFRIRVEGDNADAPSGTILGATSSAITPEFSFTATGFTGLQALAENTGNLTVNTPVWLIIYRSSGSSLSGTNNIRFRGPGSWASPLHGQTRCRLYTGGNWSTAPTINRASYVIKHADNSYDGVPQVTGLVSPTAATDIHGDYRHGIRIKSGSQLKIVGFIWYPIKTGSPNNLIAAVFEGSSLKYSNEIPSASIVTTVYMPVYFSSPVLLAANTNLYIVLGQEDDANDGTLGDDGGDDSNDYDTRVFTFSDTYRSAAIPSDVAFVYGTGNDPTAYTVSDTDMPVIIPIILDPAADFDEAAAGSGGGMPILGGSVAR